MSKKILILLLTILVFALPVQAAGSDVSATDFLIGFGAMSASEVLEPDAPITRGEFARLAGEIAVSYAADETSLEQKWADVPRDSKYFNNVMLLTNLGIINGVSPLEFAPDNNISSTDACAILVRILGYDFLANEKGYVAQAGEIGLLDGVSNTTDYLTAENAYKMLRNALFAEVQFANVIDGHETNFHSAPLMEKRFGISVVTGIVTDDGVTALAGETGITEDAIKIGNIDYINNSGRNDLLGYNVCAYVKKDGDMQTVIYMHPYKQKNVVAEFTSDKIKNFNDGIYSVYKSENTEKTDQYRLVGDYKLIYNCKYVGGGVTPELLEQMMNPKFGKVTIIDNNSDRLYDVVIVEDYQTIVIRGYQNVSQTVYNALSVPTPVTFVDLQQSMSFEDTKKLELFTTRGSKMNLDNLVKNNVISVMQSADGEYAKIIVSTDKVSGTLQGVEGSRYLKIDSQMYEIASDLLSYIDIPEVGNNITLYLRHDGKIAFIEDSNELNGVYAYLHRVFYDEFEEKVRLDILTENKKIVKATFANRPVIDGVKQASPEAAKDYILAQPYAIGGLVIVKLNDADEIINMDTAFYAYGETGPTEAGANEGDKSLQIMKDKYQVNGSPTSWISSSGYVDEYTKIFVVPFDTNENITSIDQVDLSKVDLDEINVTTNSSSAISDTTSVHTRYTLDRDSLYTDAIVVYRNTTGRDLYKSTDATRASNVIVTEISQGINVNNEVGWEIWYTSGDDPKRVFTKTLNGNKCVKSGKEVQVGDIIKFATDKSGAIPDNQLVIMYSPQTDPDNLIYEDGTFTDLTYNTTGVGKWEFVILKGQVDVMTDRFVRILRTEYKNGVPSQMEILLDRSQMQYIVYKDGRVELADSTYIETVKDIGPSASDVIFNWTEGDITYAYIVQ